MGAPLNPVPQVLRIFLEGKVDNEDIYNWGNVLHCHYNGGPPNNGDCATIANEVQSSWGSFMAAECPSPTHLTKVTVTDLTSPSAGEGVWIGDVAGTRGDDSIPSNAAMLITYPAGTRYKGGHPRTYLYVLGNADLEGAAKWSTAGVAEVQTHWREFLTAVSALGAGTTTLNSFGFVRYRGKYLPNSGAPHFYLDSPFYTPINVLSAIAIPEMASQRRRIGRRKA